MTLQYPPLANGAYRYGDPAAPLPSPVPGPPPHGVPTGPPPPASTGFAGPGQAAPGPNGVAGPGQAPPAGAWPELPWEGRPVWDGPPVPRRRRLSAGTGAATGIALLALVGVVAVGAVRHADREPAPSRSTGVPRVPRADTQPPADLPASGTFLVNSSPGSAVSGDESGCRLPPSLSDIGPGTPVVLRTPAGESLASTRLDYSAGGPEHCEFSFRFLVPSGEPVYLLEIPGRGSVPFAEDELREGVQITLGG